MSALVKVRMAQAELPQEVPRERGDRRASVREQSTKDAGEGGGPTALTGLLPRSRVAEVSRASRPSHLQVEEAAVPPAVRWARDGE